MDHIKRRTSRKARPRQKDEDSLQGGTGRDEYKNQAKRKSLLVGTGIAYLKFRAKKILIHEWHETNCVPLDENKKDFPCLFFSL